MLASFHTPKRVRASLAALSLLAALFCPVARAADKNKDKKPEKEKKQKIEPWVEIRTAHFVVASDGGEKTARRIADEFESLVRVFQATMPNSRVNTGIPIYILAAKDGESFARVAPEFPYDKRHEQPAGIIISGQEKTYIGIRANAGGHFPYMDIFQTYAREVVKRSYRNLPPWLQEGFSTVYGSITFTDHGIRLDSPDPEDLSVLFRSPLLPLDLVLTVDAKSPYYNEGDKESVYFAESRIFVHFLIADPQIAGAKSMERYLTEVQGGTDSLKAARDAFGDLDQLQAKFSAFVNQTKPVPTDLTVSGTSEPGGAPRTLSPAEFEARSADFLAVRGRSDDAESDLEEALRTDPSLAMAEQSLGFLLLKKQNLDDAEKHFQSAVKLDPKDGLNFYGLGLVVMAKAANAGTPAGAVDAFEKAAALNPDFSPAWDQLAMIYSDGSVNLQKALADAQRAAALAPGNLGYQSQVASLQDQLSDPDKPRKSSATAKESATSRAVSDKLPVLISKSELQQPAATPASAAPAPTSPTPARPASTASASSTATAKTESAPTPAPAPVVPLFSETRVYSMVGTIMDVTCSSAPQVQLSLKSLTILMKLHAADFGKVSIKSAGSDAPSAKTTSCASLRGRSVRISYTLVLNQPWDGEMQELEYRNQP
jgi:tetratricopeptide (TPR) repeat protein